jgi:hypothetical protein
VAERTKSPLNLFCCLTGSGGSLSEISFLHSALLHALNRF